MAELDQIITNERLLQLGESAECLKGENDLFEQASPTAFQDAVKLCLYEGLSDPSSELGQLLSCLAPEGGGTSLPRCEPSTVLQGGNFEVPTTQSFETIGVHSVPTASIDVEVEVRNIVGTGWQVQASVGEDIRLRSGIDGAEQEARITAPLDPTCSPRIEYNFEVRRPQVFSSADAELDVVMKYYDASGALLGQKDLDPGGLLEGNYPTPFIINGWDDPPAGTAEATACFVSDTGGVRQMHQVMVNSNVSVKVI